MSSYVQKILGADERVVYAAYLHWIIYLRGLGLTIFGGALGFYSATLLTLLFGQDLGERFAKPLAIVAFVIVISGAFLLLMAYIRQTATEFVITNRRLIAKYGFVSRTTFEIMINRVVGVNFDQTVTGRILGFGTVYVRGMGDDISPFDNISNPERFHNALMGVVDGLHKAAP